MADLVPEESSPFSIPTPTELMPWGFWWTWLWMIPLSVAILLAQTAVVVAYLVVQGILSEGSGATFRPDTLVEEIGSNGLVLSLCTLATTTLVLLLLPPIVWLRRMSVAGYLGIDRPSGKQLLIGAILVAVLVVATDLSTWALGRSIIPEFMVQVDSTAGFVPLLWLALMVLAPVGEELVFRGFLLAPRGSRLVAAAGLLLTSLAWAAIHTQYELHGIVSIFCTGLVLGAVRLRTGSTTLTIWMHALMNAVSTAELYAYLDLG